MATHGDEGVSLSVSWRAHERACWITPFRMLMERHSIIMEASNLPSRRATILGRSGWLIGRGRGLLSGRDQSEVAGVLGGGVVVPLLRRVTCP